MDAPPTCRDLPDRIADLLNIGAGGRWLRWLPAGLSRQSARLFLLFGHDRLAWQTIAASQGKETADLSLRARILDQLDRYDQELDVLEQLQAKLPNSAQVKARIAKSRSNLMLEGQAAAGTRRDLVGLGDFLGNIDENDQGGSDTRADIGTLMATQPHNPKEAVRILNRLEKAGGAGAAIDRATEFGKRFFWARLQFTYLRGRLLWEMRRFEEAAQAFRGLTSLPVVGQRARYYVARAAEIEGEVDAAIRILLQRPAWLRSPQEELLLARLHLRAGCPEAAALHALKTLRMSPRLHNATVLADCALHLHGHAGVEQVEAVFRDHFVRSRGRNSVLARMAMLRLDFATAHAEAGALGTEWDNRHNFQILKECLWQRGEGERAWRLGIAMAFDLPDLASNDEATYQQAARKLTDRIRGRAAVLTRAGAAKAFAEGSLEMGAMLLNALQLKENVTFSSSADAVLADLWRLEQSGDDRAFVTQFSNKAAIIIGSTSAGARLGGLYWRLAQAQLRLADPYAALADIERACFYLRAEPGLKLVYRDLLASVSPAPDDNSTARTAILILSCEKNLARSSLIAEAVADTAQRPVLVLIGSALDGGPVRLDTQPWGHVLKVPCGDDYNSLTHKLTWAYRYLYAVTGCTGVLKIDDDIVIADAGRFRTLLDRLDRESRDYLGRMRFFSNPVFHHSPNKSDMTRMRFALHGPVHYCDGACGYFLSRKALRQIFECSLSYFEVPDSHVTYEDAFFAELLTAGGIRPVNLDMPVNGGYEIDCFEPEKVLPALEANLSPAPKTDSGRSVAGRDRV